MQVAERNLQIVYFSTPWFDEQVAVLQARLLADPEDAAARDRLALMYYYGGDPATAAREWRLVLQSRPRDARVYLRIGRAEEKRGDLDAALVALRNAAVLAPREARIHLQIGEVLYHRGLHTDAREPLEHAVSLDDTLAEAHHLLTFVYAELGDNERAGAAAERAAELNPSYSRAEASLSLDRYSPARYAELVGERNARPAVAEGGTLAHYNLGLAFRQKGYFAEALREYRMALDAGEDRRLSLQAMAEVHLLRRELGAAIELYDGLLREVTDSPKLWNERGVCLHQAGRRAEAIASYERAMAVDIRFMDLSDRIHRLTAGRRE